ncbi:MAG: energy transducer TonB [Cyanobacteria bacterium J06632_3]
MGYLGRNGKASVFANKWTSKWQCRLPVASLPVAAIALMFSSPQNARAFHVQPAAKADVHSSRSYAVDAAADTKADYEALRERLSGSRDSDGNFEALRERLRRSRSVSCVRCTRPDYPREVVEAGEGSSVMELTFDENGNVIDAVLERSSGNAALDQAALEAAQQYVLETHGNSGTIFLEVDFNIEGNADFEERRSQRHRIQRRDERTPLAPSE